jgi:hypothetical protein
MCEYFKKQRIDRAGILAVRLQKLLIFLYAISLLAVALDIYVSIKLKVVLLLPFMILIGNWIVWFVGFRGAAIRHQSLLALYFGFTLVGSILQVLAFLFTSVGGSLITIFYLNKCARDEDCPEHVHAVETLKKYPVIIAFFFGLSILFWVIPLFFNIIGLALSHTIRKELKAIKMAEEEAKKEEEGIDYDDDSNIQLEYLVVKPDMEVPVMPMPVVASDGQPIFYPAPNNPYFQQQGYYPVGQYAPQAMMAYPYPVGSVNQ